MRIAEVIGSVTLNKQLSSFAGSRLRLAVPLSLENIQTETPPQGDSMVVWDELGVGFGGKIAVSEGSEAAQPFRPELKPVDAYCAAILDDLHL